MANDKDVSFAFNKYNEAELSERRTTVANTVINACFMIPGNLPSDPTKGVNIKQYFYKEQDAISTEKIRNDLIAACGQIICGATIGSVDFSVQKIGDGDTIFLLIIMVTFNPGEQEMLGITMKQTSKDYVKFNFDYVKL